MEDLNLFLTKIYNNQYYKNIDNHLYDPIEFLQTFIKPVALASDRKITYNKVRKEKQENSVDKVSEWIIKEELKNTMTIKAKDSSTQKMEIHVLKRDIDFKKYDFKNCKYLAFKEEFKGIEDSYTAVAKSKGIRLIQFLLLWFTFSSKTVTSHKCMRAGIGEKNTCANNFSYLVEMGYCDKYSMGNGFHNNYTLTDKGIDLLLEMMKEIEIIDSSY